VIKVSIKPERAIFYTLYMTWKNLPITVKEARKLLGKDCGMLSDTQVEELIEIFNLLAIDYLRTEGSKQRDGV
jgi:hypothetical protein